MTLENIKAVTKGLFSLNEFELRKSLELPLVSKIRRYTIEEIISRRYRFIYMTSAKELKELLNIPSNEDWTFENRVKYVLENF